MKSKKEYVHNLLKQDRNILLADCQKKPIYEETEQDVTIVADFTEYNPLHLGHEHCYREACKQVPEGIFVAVIPGLLERSGRGVPYMMTREARAEAAISIGVDIVVEGPPMGIMGSGQYSLCLAKMFQALDVDYIPRGYRPVEGLDLILQRINKGVGVAPKPYRMVDMETGEILMHGKLDEDNYVIVSLSKSLTKIRFNFKDKFLFIKRVEGISGSRIRELIVKNDLKSAKNMLPLETIPVIERETIRGRAPLHNIRDEEFILDTVNHKPLDYLKSLSLVDENTAEVLVEKRPFNSVEDIQNVIPSGFSRHHPQRVLSSIEGSIFKDTLHRYIENYPPLIRILKYKNKKCLHEFQKRIPHRRIEYGY